MKNNVIIGAGQIGSRHLQGMLKIKESQNIYVIDSSTDSLAISELRAKEIPHTHTLGFYTEWSKLPKDIDVAIIATGASVREKLLYKLFTTCNVKYLILEKVLFQELDAFYRVTKFIKNTNTKVWVNHARRTNDYYKELSSITRKIETKKLFTAIGSNWGLGCNALHFIDLFVFWANSNVKSIQTDWLDKEIIPSKRAGYIEFTGFIKGELLNGDCFVIGSLKDELPTVTVSINTSYNSWVIREGAISETIHTTHLGDKKTLTKEFKLAFQSDTTNQLLNDLFTTGNCDLPTLDESIKTHKPFIKSMLQFVNKINKSQSAVLAIT